MILLLNTKQLIPDGIMIQKMTKLTFSFEHNYTNKLSAAEEIVMTE